MLRLKYTTFNFGWGSVPDPAGGTLQHFPDLLAGFKRATSKGAKGKGGKTGGKTEGKRRGGEGTERERPPRVGLHTPCSKS